MEKSDKLLVLTHPNSTIIQWPLRKKCGGFVPTIQLIGKITGGKYGGPICHSII